MPETAAWPSGARDTTEFPKVEIEIGATFREHLGAFLQMDGLGWNDYDQQREVGGQTAANSRLRTFRKMYEKMGLIYRENDCIRLSRLGLSMRNLEADLNEKKEQVLGELRDTAVQILSRYQLRNPVDAPDLPPDCDVLPCICIWQAMRQLDNKINFEEMNRVILHVMKMEDLPAAIDKIRAARVSAGNYEGADADTLNTLLGEPVHTVQPPARIAPWFSFAGWGGLIIEQNNDDAGYRNLVPGAIPILDAVLSNPPAYYDAVNEDDWLEYYIGSAADSSEDEEVTEDVAISHQTQKRNFRTWLQSQLKNDGQPYSNNTINTYLSQIQRGYAAFDPYNGLSSPFDIQDVSELDRYTSYLFHAPGFDEFNARSGNHSCSQGLRKYREYLLSLSLPDTHIRYNTPLRNEKARNRILFGAPGTGKSYRLNKERKDLLGEDNEADYERVTFHPDYSYANFVGTYKPVPEGNGITYKYVPGPFMRVYVNALKNGRTDNVRPFLLIIEEINRANVAAVFGDIFQLLDRDDENVSEYPIQATEDMKGYLADQLGGTPDEYDKIRIPNNMFIWATMNSADQGVFPMDTAFKRRWDFTYIGINDSDEEIRDKAVILGEGAFARYVVWNELRKAINDRLSALKINEDKLLGPFFLSNKIYTADGDIDTERFISTFKNKVLMYLFEDAAKQKRSSLFAEDVDTTKYSAICRTFDEKGVFVFCADIHNKFQASAPPAPVKGDA